MKRPLFVAGKCVACGCTDDRACVGGCCWVDAGHSLCSRCFRIVVLLVWAWTRKGVGL